MVCSRPSRCGDCGCRYLSCRSECPRSAQTPAFAVATGRQNLRAIIDRRVQVKAGSENGENRCVAKELENCWPISKTRVSHQKPSMGMDKG